MTAPTTDRPDLLDLPIHIVRGTPRAMGRALGEMLAEPIRRFVDVRFTAMHRYVQDRGEATTEGILDIAHDSMHVHEQWDPRGHAEHVGIAEGAGVHPVDLYCATNMTDMRDVLLLAHPEYEQPNHPTGLEGCTSAMIPAGRTREGHAIVGQTWDLNPTDVEFVVGVRRYPDEGPETFSVTCVGCLSLVGMNAEGVAVGTTNIKTHGARPGVGYLGILHRAIHARTADEASELVRSAPLAGAHTYWVADATHQIEWEAAPDIHWRRDTADGPVWRTNHCISPDHQAVQGEPTSESSQKRFDFMARGLARDGLDTEALKALFADRSDGVNSVNRYPEDDQGTATNAVVVAVPADRRLMACRGPADRGRWVEVRFDG